MNTHTQSQNEENLAAIARYAHAMIFPKRNQLSCDRQIYSPVLFLTTSL